MIVVRKQKANEPKERTIDRQGIDPFTILIRMKSSSMQISTLTYDQLFEGILGVAVCGIVLAALWIVHILIRIEASKAAFYSVNVDDGTHSLEMHEEGISTDDAATEASSVSGMMEVEGAPSKAKSPTGASAAAAKKRPRRIRTSFKLMQLGSVSVLLLLTYLLLVVSAAPMWASALGSLCVFGIFLRYQIGEELRRQRLDRIALMLSLFLLIASLMSVCTYAFKSLGNGEIYEGPARIVGYDQSGYNNTDHDPSTRTDLEVQWGKAWGCPLSGGKVCQAVVQGAMCTVNLDPKNGKNHGNRRRMERRRRVSTSSSSSSSSHSNTHKSGSNTASGATNNTTVGATNNTTAEELKLQAENSELETENQQLQKEVEGRVGSIECPVCLLRLCLRSHLSLALSLFPFFASS